MRTRLPSVLTLPSSTDPTFSFWPMVRRSPSWPLNWNDEVRAATRSLGVLASSFSSSSASPSEKYSWDFPGLVSTNGNTAIEGVGTGQWRAALRFRKNAPISTTQQTASAGASQLPQNSRRNLLLSKRQECAAGEARM